nr:PREDICTED: potassium/sodium hyperpolarization-activated cyclic nucleotide-gated channel 2-like [Latimeria chalumnae]|eukprot:XP_014351625.1 PREDICTED: potassium/sodium hyperpolarization-activated cyclic nucleotide-gated channel 2-like [Latimeria chalumnae]
MQRPLSPSMEAGREQRRKQSSTRTPLSSMEVEKEQRPKRPSLPTPPSPFKEAEWKQELKRSSSVAAFAPKEAPKPHAPAKVVIGVEEEEQPRGNQDSSPKRHFGIFLPRFSKASTNFFGSEKAILEECNRTLDTSMFVIHPYSVFRSYWLVSVMIVTIVNIIVIPLGASFFIEEAERSFLWLTFNMVSDVVFIMDLILNFFTGYTSEQTGSVIVDPRLIRRCYVRTWFFPDLIAVLPVDYVLLFAKFSGFHRTSSKYGASRIMRLIKLSRVCSLLRLFRFSRLVRYVYFWDQAMSVMLIDVERGIFGLEYLLLREQELQSSPTQISVDSHEQEQ